MKFASIVLLVVTLFYQQRIVHGIYGFGREKRPEEERVRIYLNRDEALLVPENSNVKYIQPALNMNYEEVYREEPMGLSSEMDNLIKDEPQYLPLNNLLGYRGSTRGLKIQPTADASTNYFGGYFIDRYPSISLGAHPAGVQGLQKQLGKFTFLPHRWIQKDSDIVKPIKEEHPDDLKFDFRTQMHSIR